ncbi:MAG TPA: ATP-binding protein [Bacteroidia bacterium]|nr:ATP-binding protein [Bacteroidia bacterium]
MLDQSPVLKNLIITGLRGVGKTVLLDTLKPIAVEKGWFWAGTDLSESASVSEQTLATRILADFSGLLSSFSIGEREKKTVGYISTIQKTPIHLSYDILINYYNRVPGLVSDKLKSTLEFIWNVIKEKAQGVVLAYDEAQMLKDYAADKQYPLSVLLEVVQYLQKKEIPYLLALTGLPTLFPNLVEARTYAERMFHVTTLDKLTEEESREAIVTPVEKENCPVAFSADAIDNIIKTSGGYPYFIQFFCKEAYDSYLQQKAVGVKDPLVTISELVRKLDSDFYAGRWSKTTERQRYVLEIAARLANANEEFTGQDILIKVKQLKLEPLSASYLNQLLKKLIESGFIYKNKHGKYSFAVPMLADYINRQNKNMKL